MKTKVEKIVPESNYLKVDSLLSYKKVIFLI